MYMYIDTQNYNDIMVLVSVFPQHWQKLNSNELGNVVGLSSKWLFKPFQNANLVPSLGGKKSPREKKHLGELYMHAAWSIILNITIDSINESMI